jgi:voltage-gated potassium channel
VGAKSRAGLTALRRRLNPYFDDDAPQTLSARVFNLLLALLIVVNVAAIILESVKSLASGYAVMFSVIENAATAVFAIEYVLRAWTAVDRVSGAYSNPIWGRIRYLRSFFALIDLAAVLPALLGFIAATDLRVLRILRLLRMLKLTRHSTIFSLIWAVIRDELHAIGAIVFVLCLILVLSGSLAYVLEADAQPDVFTSIPVGIWWAVEAITTVGYGDIVPVTVAGRILGSAVSVIGIITFAMFSGLITVGFMEQLRMRREHYRRLVEQRLADGALNKHDLETVTRVAARMGLTTEETAEAIAEAVEGSRPR